MEVTIVTTQAERDEMKSTLDGYADMGDGKMSKETFRASYPAKVWIDTELCKSYDARLPFMVVDNREGECFCEDFVSLDGAVLYATDVHMTPEHQDEWDYPGAVKDGGDILFRLTEGDASKARGSEIGGS